MKILKNAGKHRILAIMVGLDGKNPIQLIELAGRTAYQSRDKITDQSAERFLRMIKTRGHESVLEHSCMTVEFNNVSRGFTHELVRHRLAAYTQESTRYVDESNFNVIVPPHKDEKEKLAVLILPDGYQIKVSVEEWFGLNEQMYRQLRLKGWVPQDARQILPTGIKAQIVMTANFREWKHVIGLRAKSDAHWEIKKVMSELLTDIKIRIPIIFDDL